MFPLFTLVKQFFAICLSICILAIFSLSQTTPDSIELVLNQPIEREIKGGETHTFKIQLKAGETARTEVVQKNIDVIVSLFSSDGKLIVEMDGNDRILWKEVLTSIATNNEIYEVKVKAYGSNDLIGSYKIRLFDLRKTDDKDLKIQRAEKTIEQGRVLQNREGKFNNDAVLKFRQAANLWREIGDLFWESNSLLNLGILLTDLSKNEEAETIFLSALKKYRQIGDKIGEGTVLNGLGNVYLSLAKFDKAITYYQESLAIRTELKDERTIGESYNKLGLCYLYSGQIPKAKDYFEKALYHRRKAFDKRGEAGTLGNLGLVHNNFGEYQKAKKYFEEGLVVAREIHFRKAEANILQGLAVVYGKLSQIEKAIEYAKLALEIQREVNNKFGISNGLNNISLYYKELKQCDKAIEFLEAGLVIAKEIGNSYGERYILQNLGQTHICLGNTAKAIEYFQLSLQKSAEIDDKIGESEILTIIGSNYLSIKQHNKAKEYFGRALINSTQLKNADLTSMVNNSLMLLWISLNQPNTAIFYGKQNVNIMQQIRSNIKDLDQTLQDSFIQTREDTYRETADLLISQGRFREAQQVLDMLKESEYFEFIRRDKSEIEKLSKRVDLTAKEKAVLDEYLKLSDKITSLGQELQTLEEKQQKLAKDQFLSDMDKARIEELRQLLKNANEAFQLFLEKDLIAQLSNEAVKGIEDDKSLQSDLKTFGKYTVSVYTVLANNRYRAILTTPYTQTGGKTEISLTELNKKIFNLRTALMDPNSDPKPLGKELYDILIKPIEKDLEGSKAKTIVWSLDGTLRYIPISALWDGKQYLLEKYQNIILTPATRTSARATNKTNWSVLAGGVSDAQEIKLPLSEEVMKFSQLPRVKSELQTIVSDKENTLPKPKGFLKGKVLLDKEFSPQKLTDSLQEKDQTGGKRFNLIHLASHFWLGNNTLDSFLLLGDGKYVTLEQIKKSPEFDLAGVELVTLSACNTGFNGGNGAEIDSLATLLESRGAKASLSTLWAIADESTSGMMIEFYRIKKDNPNMSKSEALRKAQIKLLKDKSGKYAHPFYWAPFVMVGNWR